MATRRSTTRKSTKSLKKKASSPSKPVVALTGVTGFLGGSLLQLLEADSRYERIIAIDRRKPRFPLKKSKFYRVNLTETLADSKIAEIFKKEGVTIVVHAAFPVTPLHNNTLAHEIQSVGTMYLLNACVAQRIDKLILASTTDVYGALPSNPNYLSEDHPPRGGRKSSFIRDKIDAENQVMRFSKNNPATVVSILRPCTILGPKVRNFKTTFLKRRAVFTVMGFDPLMQFVHEEDVMCALLKVLNENHPGIFNIVGPGVLPLSQILYLSGKLGVPVPSPMLYPIAQLMWYTDIFPAPASHLDFLKYLCVADGSKAKEEMGFVAKYSSTEALLAFIGAERLRRVHLLEEQA